MSQGELLRAIDFLAAAIAAVKDGSEPRIQLEMALLKATQPSADLSLQALMHRIERLESGLRRGAASGPRPPPAAGAAAGARAGAGGGATPPGGRRLARRRAGRRRPPWPWRRRPSP